MKKWYGYMTIIHKAHMICDGGIEKVPTKWKKGVSENGMDTLNWDKYSSISKKRLMIRL